MKSAPPPPTRKTAPTTVIDDQPSARSGGTSVIRSAANLPAASRATRQILLGLILLAAVGLAAAGGAWWGESKKVEPSQRLVRPITIDASIDAATPAQELVLMTFIDSEPDHAKVLIGDQVQCLTPCNVGVSPLKNTKLVIHLDGYEEKVVKIRPDSKRVIRVRLKEAVPGHSTHKAAAAQH